MQLTFLCGSLEPGQDGIGDYTRRLAASCRAQGVQANIIALHDRHAQEVWEEQAPLPLLRLPRALSWDDKLSHLQPVMDRIRPDWLSLQYSPYSFYPRGLATPLNPLFQFISSGRRLHIMFHEIWIGLATGDTWRHRLAGKWQRHTLHRFLGKNKPHRIHTHTPLYRDQLQALGYAVELLPLFGNIDRSIDANAKSEAIRLIRSHLPGWDADNTRLLLFFGTLHREWDPATFARQINASQSARSGKIAILHTGHNAHPGQWTAFKEKLDTRIATGSLGPQPAPVISSLLSLADFGLTTTPETHLYKSGTIAAMHEHGLPIMVLRSNEGTLPEPYRHLSQLHKLLDNPPARMPPNERLTGITRQFLQSLT